MIRNKNWYDSIKTGDEDILSETKEILNTTA